MRFATDALICGSQPAIVPGRYALYDAPARARRDPMSRSLRGSHFCFTAE
jgi:hypothetical protein